MSGAEGRLRVLLVEDSEAIREAFTVLLEESGFAVATAGTADEAIREAAAARPDLVLLDLGLPGADASLPGAAGIEVVRSLKASPSTSGVAVVALTGRDSDADRQVCMAAGCADYLVKPVDTRELLRAIPEYVRRAQADPIDANPSPS